MMNVCTVDHVEKVVQNIYSNGTDNNPDYEKALFFVIIKK